MDKRAIPRGHNGSLVQHHPCFQNGALNISVTKQHSELVWTSVFYFHSSPFYDYSIQFHHCILGVLGVWSRKLIFSLCLLIKRETTSRFYVSTTTCNPVILNFVFVVMIRWNFWVVVLWGEDEYMLICCLVRRVNQILRDQRMDWCI